MLSRFCISLAENAIAAVLAIDRPLSYRNKCGGEETHTGAVRVASSSFCCVNGGRLRSRVAPRTGRSPGGRYRFAAAGTARTAARRSAASRSGLQPRFTPQNSVEVTYYDLGKVKIEGLPVDTHEHAWAISGSFVHVSPPFSQWIGPGPWNDYLHVFVRLGLAYKHVTQDSVIGTIDEGFLSAVIGTGLEVRFTPQFFGRIEYEFLSTAIGGPRESVPGFQGPDQCQYWRHQPRHQRDEHADCAHARV
jgi:hypothetical protein